MCHLASTLMSPTHHAVLQQQTKSYSSNTTPHAHSCRDKIHMEALSFHGYHGVLHAEKVLGQKFVVDVTMSVCHLTSGQSDDIKDTVDYASAYELIKEQVEGKDNAKDLIERVGAGIATELLKKFEKVIDVTVRVQKPHVAVTHLASTLMSPTHHAVLQQQTKSYSSNTTPHAHSCRDKIHMEALSFHGYHGVLHAEKVLGQKFVVDVTMSVCHLTSGQSDDIKDTVDYASAYELIKEQVEGKDNAKDLIERVGAGIATELLKKFEKVIDVTVRVQKPHVAVTGTVGSLGIEVFRQRE